MPEANVIYATGISFGYEKGKYIFQDVDFSLSRNEIHCLFGPNGCGKTTLLDCVMGINKVSKGEIKIIDKDISRYKRAELAKQVAYVPQLHNRTFPYTVRQVVMMGRNAYSGVLGSPGEEDEAIALESIAQVGMERFTDTPYTQLSGGEVQLVMLARALGQRTKIIVLDEPTCHLDFANELMFLETLVKLCKETEQSVLIATHSPDHAYYFETQGLSARVTLMYGKKAEQAGAPKDILTEENLERVYGVKAKLLSYTDEDGKQRRNISLLKTIGKGVKS